MLDELKAVYKNLCINVSNLEEAFVNEDRNEFYTALGEMDECLDLLREIIKD